MIVTDISGSLPWKFSIGKRDLNSVTGIVVHHTANPAAGVGEGEALQRVKNDAFYHISKGWGHLAYHYVISPDGTVFKCLDEREIGAHAGDWEKNKRTIAVCMDGDYTKERPSQRQISALWGLLDSMCYQRPDLPGVTKDTVRTHREVRPVPTACPSERLQKFVEAYRV